MQKNFRLPTPEVGSNRALNTEFSQSGPHHHHTRLRDQTERPASAQGLEFVFSADELRCEPMTPCYKVLGQHRVGTC
jgi:hypothetical protein